jgi:hypothetical protein
VRASRALMRVEGWRGAWKTAVKLRGVGESCIEVLSCLSSCFEVSKESDERA